MKDPLIARREQAEHSFSQLVKQKQQKEQEMNDIDTELARLQGEYRLIDDLLKEKKKVSPKAEVIDVTGEKQ